jgi:hypothetical protein
MGAIIHGRRSEKQIVMATVSGFGRLEERYGSFASLAKWEPARAHRSRNARINWSLSGLIR